MPHIWHFFFSLGHKRLQFRINMGVEVRGLVKRKCFLPPCICPGRYIQTTGLIPCFPWCIIIQPTIPISGFIMAKRVRATEHMRTRPAFGQRVETKGILVDIDTAQIGMQGGANIKPPSAGSAQTARRAAPVGADCG